MQKLLLYVVLCAGLLSSNAIFAAGDYTEKVLVVEWHTIANSAQTLVEKAPNLCSPVLPWGLCLLTQYTDINEPEAYVHFVTETNKNLKKKKRLALCDPVIVSLKKLKKQDITLRLVCEGEQELVKLATDTLEEAGLDQLFESISSHTPQMQPSQQRLYLSDNALFSGFALEDMPVLGAAWGRDNAATFTAYLQGKARVAQNPANLANDVLNAFEHHYLEN